MGPFLGRTAASRPRGPFYITSFFNFPRSSPSELNLRNCRWPPFYPCRAAVLSTSGTPLPDRFVANGLLNSLTRLAGRPCTTYIVLVCTLFPLRLSPGPSALITWRSMYDSRFPFCLCCFTESCLPSYPSHTGSLSREITSFPTPSDEGCFRPHFFSSPYPPASSVTLDLSGPPVHEDQVRSVAAPLWDSLYIQVKGTLRVSPRRR